MSSFLIANSRGILTGTSSRRSAAAAYRRINSSATGQKPKVVVVGCGWGGARAIRDLDPNLFDIHMVAPRNHMVFTPLLPQTSTGTLEFRSVLESLDRIQPKLTAYHYGLVTGIRPDENKVNCITYGKAKSHSDEVPEERTFELSYDYLVLAHGAAPTTFGTPGVEEHAYFMREIHHAREVRKAVLDSMNEALALDATDEGQRKKLLHTVVVGGGPTGVEFAGDMRDFQKSLGKLLPKIADEFKLTLINPGEILLPFDKDLREYALKSLQGSGVNFVDSAVKAVHEDELVLRDGTNVPYGVCVWSTGVGPNFWTEQMTEEHLAKTDRGRIKVDGHLRALRASKNEDDTSTDTPISNVFAIGDAAGELPTLAAVAMRQGAYVANLVNDQVKGKGLPSPYKYESLGSMVSFGPGKAIIDLPGKFFDTKGFAAFLGWRAAYFTMLGSFRSRLYVAINWFSTMVVGRDLAYIPDEHFVRHISEDLDKRFKAGGKIKRGII